MTAGTDIQSPADAATFIARLIEAARAFIVARVNAVSAAGRCEADAEAAQSTEPWP